MSVGTELRAQRMKLGWDVAEIASYLRIQPNYLEAIEAEDFRELPGGAYTIGFVKTYARHLGLPVEAIAATFRREQADALQVAPLRIRSAIVESRVPTVSVVVFALLIAAAGWIFWAYFGSKHQVVANTVPAVPERLAQPIEHSALPVSDGHASTAAPPLADAPVVSSPSGIAQQAAPAPLKMPVTQSGTGDSDEARNDTGQSDQSIGVRTAPVNQDTGAGSVLGSATSQSRVEIHTSDNSWIQIRDASHNAIYTGVMHAGDVYKLPTAPGYTFTAGNAGAVMLVVDGVPSTVLGPPGQVLRNVAIPDKR